PLGARVDGELDVAGTRYIAAGQDRLSDLGALLRRQGHAATRLALLSLTLLGLPLLAGPAPVGRSDLVDPAAVAGPDLGSGHVAGAAAAPAGLAAAGSGPWSDRAAVVPGYAAGSDPACHDPAAPPDHADSGALGPWSRPSARAAIGPASGLACVAAMALACHARA